MKKIVCLLLFFFCISFVKSSCDIMLEKNQYKPGEILNANITIREESGSQSTLLNITIKDVNGQIIDEEMFSTPTGNYTKAFQFIFPLNATLGNWSITAEYSSSMVSKPFTVYKRPLYLLYVFIAIFLLLLLRKYILIVTQKARAQ